MINWGKDGYTIIRGPETNLMEIFMQVYYPKFTSDPERNRNLLKRFAADPEVVLFFAQASQVMREIGMEHPTLTGPVFSHYTHTDHTGGGYGLEPHRDWESMATSNNGAAAWMPLTDVTEDTHGLQIKPVCFTGTEEELSVNEPWQSIKMKAGDVLVFSPWLLHRTFLNPHATDFRLALSQRYDDVECPKWAARRFRSAYSTEVDRKLWQR